MIVLTADHLIRQNARFRDALLAAAQMAASGALVTLGIHPRGPVTGFGYIEQGEALGQFGGFEAYRVVRFTEKPDPDTARRFVASGRYHWNSGMFVWRVEAIMAEIARQMPDLHAALTEIDADIGEVSIDYGVMEGARATAVLPVDVGWRDVGSWAAVYEESASAPGANVVLREGNGELLAVDTKGCLVHSDKLVVTLGLRDLVIVDTGDVLMICPRDRAQEVRKLVEALQDEQREEYL
jgi:mannose-1-phosphate guanylyltransferase